MSAVKSALIVCAAAGFLVSAPATLIAQTATDPTTTAMVRYGPIAFTPALVFSMGHDTNVYHEPTGFADYETFVVPQIEGWWKQPGFRVRMIGAVELVHFANNPGATNWQAGGGIERLNSTIRPYFNYTLRQTNANPTGFEVGYKSLRIEGNSEGGANVTISPRSELRFLGRFVRTNWDADAIYQSSSLREKLNRDTASAGGGYAYKLTPLTAIGVTTDFTQDRFKYSPIRDGDTVRAAGLVEFGRPAFIFGNAQAGYLHFTSPASGVANFNGPVVSANVGYGTPDGTLIKLYVNRDLEYSFDTELGYYVLNSLSVTVSRRILQRWDVAGFGGRHGLDYRPAGTTASIGRVDVVSEYGGAAAYRIGSWTRVGVTVEDSSKTGPDGYNSLRIVGFLTYGSGRFQRLDRPTPFER